MYAYELYPKLALLTLTVEESEYWEDQLVFIGTEQQWKSATLLEQLCDCQ